MYFVGCVCCVCVSCVCVLCCVCIVCGVLCVVFLWCFFGVCFVCCKLYVLRVVCVVFVLSVHSVWCVLCVVCVLCVLCGCCMCCVLCVVGVWCVVCVVCGVSEATMWHSLQPSATTSLMFPHSRRVMIVLRLSMYSIVSDGRVLGLFVPLPPSALTGFPQEANILLEAAVGRIVFLRAVFVMFHSRYQSSLIPVPNSIRPM